MTPKVNPLDFQEKYTLIGSLDSYAPLVPRYCRFCGEGSDNCFTTRNHLIPELLGRNNYLSKDECDNCNRYFSPYESHLGILARPYMTLINIKTKKHTPAFQSRAHDVTKQRTTVKVDQNTLQRVANVSSDDVKINRETGVFELTLRNPEFRPIYVYKALCKIAIGVMPPEILKKNQDFSEWLIDKKELFEIPHGFMTKLTRKFFPTPSIMLYQAKEIVVGDIERPEFIGIVCFANVVIQFFLPISQRLAAVHSDKRGMQLDMFPSFAYDGMPEGPKIIFNPIHMNLTKKEMHQFNDIIVMKGDPTGFTST